MMQIQESDRVTQKSQTPRTPPVTSTSETEGPAPANARPGPGPARQQQQQPGKPGPGGPQAKGPGPAKGPQAVAGEGAPAQPDSPQPAQPKPQASPAAVPPPAPAARAKTRHWLVLVSFFLMVAAPAGGASWYLWRVAVDQYASTVAFSVRREEASSAVETLIGITGISGSSSTDTDILYEFLQSQRLVAEMDEEVDLRGKWSKPEGDPIFTFDSPGSIEDLVDYWGRMVKIYYDSGAGLLEIRVQAFEAEDATLIAETLFDKSAEMINELSDIAREDAIRYARDELEGAVERLKVAREAVTQFRNTHQLVDPSVDMQTQAGLLGNLQAQLAEALIEVDILSESTGVNDPRMAQARRRVEVIQARIADERRKLGQGEQSVTGEVFADLVGEYERLTVDREFAENTYTSAMAAYDAALAEARRKSRYLAAHVKPTMAETARYPDRPQIILLLSLFLFLTWVTVMLVVYSIRDRR